MPNIKSAKKRVLVNAAKTAENKARKTNLKTVIKNAELALANNDEHKAEAVKLAVKKIDQAAHKNILHKNNAARKKAHLTGKLNVQQ